MDESNCLAPPTPPLRPKVESISQVPPVIWGPVRGRPHSSVSLSTIPEETTPPSSTTPPGQNLTVFAPFQPQCLQRREAAFAVLLIIFVLLNKVTDK